MKPGDSVYCKKNIISDKQIIFNADNEYKISCVIDYYIHSNIIYYYIYSNISNSDYIFAEYSGSDSYKSTSFYNFDYFFIKKNEYRKLKLKKIESI